jgi:hypothetical protein
MSSKLSVSVYRMKCFLPSGVVVVDAILSFSQLTKRASSELGHTRRKVYESKSDSTYIPFRSSTDRFITHTFLQTPRSLHCVGRLIGYSPPIRKWPEGVRSEKRDSII